MKAFIKESRLMGFSDSVFAFAATLLVLKINVPILAGDDVAATLLPSLLALWPQYLANVISFLVIGFYWINHHTVFNQIKRLNGTVVWLNIIFLIFISFLPFPVDLYGDFSTSPVVIAFYSLSVAMVGFALAVLWLYASTGRRLIDKSLNKRQIELYSLELLFAPLVFLISAPLAFVDPVVSQFSWGLVIIGILVLRRLSPDEIG